MSGHTPGPWELFIDDSGTGEWAGWPISIDAPDDPDKTIVRTGGFYPYSWGTATSQDEAIANARLIAAAPETAAELERVREINAELVEALERIMNLSAGGPHVSAEDGFSAALCSLGRARDIALDAVAKATPSTATGGGDAQ